MRTPPLAAHHTPTHVAAARRRRVLSNRSLRLAGAALVAATLLAACSSGSGSLRTSPTDSGALSSGGTSSAAGPTASLAPGADRAPAPAALVSEVTSVPVAALAAAARAAKTDPDLTASGPKPIDTPALTQDGKPQLVYFGGEFCPFCAADRWVTVLALAPFGQWHDLKITRSSSSDVHPNTPTFSFHGASYTSTYLTFSGYEVADREGNRLDAVPKELQALPDTVAQAIGDSNFNPESIPFLDVGGKFVQSGSPYDPSILAGKSWQEVAAALHRPDSTIARTVLANAAELAQDLCTLTDDQPAKVCEALR